MFSRLCSAYARAFEKSRRRVATSAWRSKLPVRIAAGNVSDTFRSSAQAFSKSPIRLYSRAAMLR
eukprot:scaffold1320_cov253-Pinguiococcus_pyrenoidosus.AAC.15